MTASPIRSYHPDFEHALEGLLLAAADTAEFADGHPVGRSRQVSIRRLRLALEELHTTSREIVLAQRATHPS